MGQKLTRLIEEKLERTQERNSRGAYEYGQRLLQQLKGNLARGETVQSNQGLIDRYKSVKPYGLNQMQQAFADAIA